MKKRIRAVRDKEDVADDKVVGGAGGGGKDSARPG